MIERIPNVVRWTFLLPLSLGAAFLTGQLVRLLTFGNAGASMLPVAYTAAFVAGLAYVWVGLEMARAVAPSHKKSAVAFLGVLLVGDLSFVHLVLQPGLMPGLSLAGMEDSELNVLLGVLRAGDYADVPKAGFVKIAGVFVGCVLVWWNQARRGVPEHQS